MIFGSSFQAALALELKISHQFPGGAITEGDFRDRLIELAEKVVVTPQPLAEPKPVLKEKKK